MAKITIYLPDDIERKVRTIARQHRISASKWIAQEIKQKLDRTWSPEFLAAFGSCPDFPSLEELRSGYGEDAPREPFD